MVHNTLGKKAWFSSTVWKDHRPDDNFSPNMSLWTFFDNTHSSFFTAGESGQIIGLRKHRGNLAWIFALEIQIIESMLCGCAARSS